MRRAIRGSTSQNFRVGNMNFSSFSTFSSTRVQSSRLFSSSKMTTTQPMANTEPPILEDFTKIETEVPLQDVSVGISKFVGLEPKLEGVLIKDYSHFQVHEIDSNGEAVKLTNCRLPSDFDAVRSRPFYVHCSLYKEGYHMKFVTKFLAQHLKISLSSIGFGGVKEKNAKTTQRISLCDVPLKEMIKLSNITDRPLKFGNYSFSSKGILIGQYKGNQFQILIKDVQLKNSSSSISTFDEVVVNAALKSGVNSLRKIGFINYYDVNLFKRNGLPAHVIGQTMLQQQWEKVFDQLLLSKKGDSDILAQAKSMWFSNRDPIAIQSALPDLKRPHLASQESHLLFTLSKLYQNGQGNLFNIFKSIQRRHFYMNAFQCYLWNHLASFRVEHFGLNLIPGDIVLAKPDAFSNRTDNEDWNAYTKIKVLTEQDLNSPDRSKYSIYDVLLPAIGRRVLKYENPIIQQFFEQLLAQHESHPQIFSKFDSTQVPLGFYRKLLVRPSTMNFKLLARGTKQDEDCLQKLLVSDLDVLSNPGTSSYEETSPIDSVESANGNKMSALFQFSLPPSANPMMALREIIHVNVDRQ